MFGIFDMRFVPLNTFSIVGYRKTQCKIFERYALSHYIPFFSNLLNKQAEYIFQCIFFREKERYAMINVTPRSLHWLLRTFLLNKEAAAISRVFQNEFFFHHCEYFCGKNPSIFTNFKFSKIGK